MRQAFEKLFILSIALTIGASAQASDPKKLGEHGDWSAYVFMEGSNKVCYMVSQPQKQEGSYSQRGDVFALITHRPAENSRNVFSYIAGYPYKPGSVVTVSAGNQNFNLFTQGESAWAPDEAMDTRLAQAIQRGNSLVVKGESARGTKTTDTFGLRGSSAAFKAISTECGIQ
ncbi:MAG: invasion associated locus B family protein [Nitrosomonas sp.]|nr:invasion associated locus B family protein [Nitrosomonas sp.]MDP1949591.1 invasion associated locus B family protein [Nitrosomonas sp.]